AESNIKSGIIIGTKSMTPRVKGYFLTAKLELLTIYNEFVRYYLYN
ncbi:hypothetical protein SAMN04488098_11103, partial [Alkalibacterium thalassium]